MIKARQISYYTVEIQSEDRGAINRNIGSDDPLDALQVVTEMMEIDPRRILTIFISRHSHEVFYPEV